MRVGKVATFNTGDSLLQATKLTSEEQESILELVKIMLQVNHDHLTRIASETFVYLHASNVVRSP
jgi:hypothetical protein